MEIKKIGGREYFKIKSMGKEFSYFTIKKKNKQLQRKQKKDREDEINLQKKTILKIKRKSYTSEEKIVDKMYFLNKSIHS